MATILVLPEAGSADDLQTVATLFEAYAASLPVDLGYQDFAAELAALPGKYAPPRGALLLARAGDGTPLGCVGLRPIEPAGCCEMKRLYLVPETRGTGLGRALAEAVIAHARTVGYTELRLDTLPTMGHRHPLLRATGVRADRRLLTHRPRPEPYSWRSSCKELSPCPLATHCRSLFVAALAS